MHRDQSRPWYRNLKNSVINKYKRNSSTRKLFKFLFFVLFLGVLISVQWISDALMLSTRISSSTIFTTRKQNQQHSSPSPPPPVPIPFTCPTTKNLTTANYTCKPPPPPLPEPNLIPQSRSCPDYFRYIHEDLRPWKPSGITRNMLNRAQETANFRLVILNGRAFVETFEKSFQTRDLFTLWGIVQLLRRYPGKVPDLELMFDCVDWPVVRKEEYVGRNRSLTPPLFRYCVDDSTLDIVFPDWSFWGWPEINVKPWNLLLGELKKGNNKAKWMNREPYAYWKGNPTVAETRMELVKCNVSKNQDWNARIYAQDWLSEIKKGFRESDLASQCIHRYKIYIEGSAWSVSEKYILACDSLSLIVNPKYYDFFTRELMPVQHYWPIQDKDKCRSIKYAVDWGNSHKQKAQAIGKEASRFIQEKLNMDHVYDYMLHLLTEYAKLQKFKPTKPRNAVELCAESMACPAEGLEKKFMMQSMVNSTDNRVPCSLPPPYSPQELKSLNTRKDNALKQVEMWEQKYWKSKIN